MSLSPHGSPDLSTIAASKHIFLSSRLTLLPLSDTVKAASK